MAEGSDATDPEDDTGIYLHVTVQQAKFVVQAMVLLLLLLSWRVVRAAVLPEDHCRGGPGMYDVTVHLREALGQAAVPLAW